MRLSASGTALLRPAFCILLALCACALPAAAPAQPGVVRVGVYANGPKVVIAADGTGQGIYADVLQDVAGREGWHLAWVPGTFEQGLQRLERGEVDVMVDVARTPERERRFDFGAEPVLLSWNQVYARRGAGLRNLLDLQGLRIAVLRGSVQEAFLLDAARGFGLSPTLLRHDSYASAFDAVRRGDADAVVSNPFFGSMHMEGLEDTSIIFGASMLHFAVREGSNAPLLAALDARIAQLRSQPGSLFFREQQRLLHMQRPDHLPPWLLPTAAGVLLFLALALGWSYTLGRERRRLRAALAALEQRGAELERANADLQTVGYSLSHDLRAPLAAVQGFVEAVLERARATLGAAEAKYLERSVAAARRMDTMVGELARLLKLAGEPLRLERCDLGALAREVAGELRERFDATPQVRIAEGLHVCADCHYLRLALENLLGNAWKFSAGAAAPVIEVGCLPSTGPAVFFVRDNGAGFDMAHAGSLFKPFSRLHDASEFPGTGLGLCIVERVIARHGGRVWAEAAPQQGATFYFTLPDAPLPR